MASAIQIDIQQKTPEWFRLRMSGVTASQVPVLYGVSPYSTKTDLYNEKLGFGFADDKTESYIFELGNQMEIELREEFSLLTGIDIKPTCFQKDKIYFASLDGYDKSVGVLETKLVGKAVWEKANQTGEIPVHHFIQIQAAVHASDSDKGHWLGRQKSKNCKAVAVEIGRDEKFIANMRSEVEAFWEQVCAGRAPELTEKDILFITHPDHVILFERLEQLKRQKDILSVAYEVVEDQVKQLATHPKVRCGQVTITEATRSGSIDYSKVPEIAALSTEHLNSFRGPSKTYKTIRFGRD